jgi:hypothetical protein
MHHRSLNLAADVIQIPKLSKCTSMSPNLLIDSCEVQISLRLVKSSTCQANWTLTWTRHVGPTRQIHLLPSVLPLPSLQTAAVLAELAMACYI